MKQNSLPEKVEIIGTGKMNLNFEGRSTFGRNNLTISRKYAVRNPRRLASEIPAHFESYFNKTRGKSRLISRHSIKRKVFLSKSAWIAHRVFSALDMILENYSTRYE